MPNVRHSTVHVRPANVFYREAGAQGQPVLLLLHGFANSSHYFRHSMPRLAGRFHLIAPDLPSFGFTTVEEGAGYRYTFAGLTATIQVSWTRFRYGAIPPGAEAFKRDVPGADVRFLDTGHFALETDVDDIASAILEMTVND
jgi:hypothetical protein